MPHFSDGTPASVGDIVVGSGYNAQLLGYDAKVGVVGVVTQIREGPDTAGSCTLSIMYFKFPSPALHGHGHGHDDRNAFQVGGIRLIPVLEYGDTVGFKKVGSVTPSAPVMYGPGSPPPVPPPQNPTA